MPASLALVLASSAAAAAERRYSVTDFDRVQLEGPYEVVLATGRSSHARAHGSQQALERVSIEVLGRTLRIRPNRSAWGGYPGADPGPVRIELATRELNGASVAGSGSLSIDRMDGLKLDLAVAGSGRISVGRLAADNLLVGLLGSGKIVLAGTAKQLRLTSQGSGDVDGQGLATDDAQITSDTAGSIGLAARGTAKVRASGAGDVVVTGPATCTVQALGSGRVSCGD